MTTEPLLPDPGKGRARPASVTLRTAENERAAQSALMDPANQSLAEALTFTFRIIQLAMVVLFGLFLFSGVQSVQKGESGVRLLFGRVTGDNLSAGLHFSAPYPMGELIKIPGAQVLDLDEPFWPKLTPDQKSQTIETLARSGKLALKPGEDGSLITADTNIAHAKWRVLYRRDQPATYIRNVLPDDERRLVSSAVERGVVHAVAGVTIEQLLKESPGDTGSVANRAKAIAQQSLNDIESGITIDRLDLLDRTAPFSVYNDFSNVESARSKAGQVREQALATAGRTLNTMAGAAHGLLLDLIAKYEIATDAADPRAQDEAMESLRAVFEGRGLSASVDPRGVQLSGTAAQIISQARQYKSSIVSQRRAELAAFQSKLKQFRSSPGVVTQREWADAMKVLLAKDFVESFITPRGSGVLELVLNRDVEAARAYTQKQKLAELDQTEQDRKDKAAIDKTKTRVDGVVELRER